MSSLRLPTDVARKVATLKYQLAVKLQQNFMAGGDNTQLKDECDELRRQINKIEKPYRTEAA